MKTLLHRLTSKTILQYSGMALLLAVALGLSACAKINICGKEGKLVGIWAIDKYMIGDSTVTLIDPDLIPTDFPAGGELRPLIIFQESGALLFTQFGDTGSVSSYRMERYETECLIYSDLFPYQWVIEKLGSSAMDVNSWTILGIDSLVETSYELVKVDGVL